MNGLRLSILEWMISPKLTYLDGHGIWDSEFWKCLGHNAYQVCSEAAERNERLSESFKYVCTNSPGMIYNGVLGTYSTPSFRALLHQCVIGDKDFSRRAGVNNILCKVVVCVTIVETAFKSPRCKSAHVRLGGG